MGAGTAAAGETERGEGARGFSPALGAGRPRPTSFPFGINFSPLASVSAVGTVGVTPRARVAAAAGAVACARRRARGPELARLGPAPCLGVNKHKAKRKSCQFLDPSPLSFNFLASAYCCCMGASDVRCKNNRVRASVSPASR